MASVPLPANEAARLAALQRLSILDTPPEERFDRIIRLTCHTFQVPIAMVSLSDAHRQWFKSCIGLSETESPRETAFCTYAILADDTLIVPDSHRDPRFANNPLVTGAPFIRFYAGQPLRDPEGYILGTLCIMDLRPRELSSADEQALRDLALIVENELSALELSQSLKERARAEAALQESEERYRLIVEGIKDYAITMLNPEGYIMSWNSAMERIKGYPMEDVLGRHFSCFYSPEDLQRDSPAHNLQQAARHGRFEDEGWRVRKDGSRFWANVVMTPLYDQHGTLRGFAKITRDITERKEHEAERQRLHDELIRTQELALDELSTPLIPITDSVVVMPLIGTIDSRRAQRMQESLLGSLHQMGARIAIIDLTGVPAVDTQVANALIQAATAVRLLGAQVMLTGIRAELAQTIAGLGVDLRQIITYSTLQSAIAQAVQMVGTGR